MEDLLKNFKYKDVRLLSKYTEGVYELREVTPSYIALRDSHGDYGNNIYIPLNQIIQIIEIECEPLTIVLP